MTRNPSYLHFYNTSFPELYQENEPGLYVGKLKGPVIKKPVAPPLIQEEGTTAAAAQGPGPGTYFRLDPEERLLRQEVKSKKLKAKTIVKQGMARALSNHQPVVSPSIQDQRKQYDYIQLNSDVIIVEKENHSKAWPNKVEVVNSARTW